MTAAEPSSALLDRVRKLLAKAEAEGCTPQEAEALTAKAAELMAKYGIDRARLAASGKVDDKPDDRIIGIPNPHADVRMLLLTGLGGAMRIQSVLRGGRGPAGVRRIHVFGYASDLERLDLMYTSLLMQMAQGFAASVPPAGISSVRAWRRSWLLGWVSAVTTRVQEAEERAAARSDTGPRPAGTSSTAVVLADRSRVIKQNMTTAYPVLGKSSRMTYSGSGYRDGHAKGQTADIGQSRVGGRGKALTSG